MDARSPLSYVGGALQQVAFVVKDLTAAQEFFNRRGGSPYQGGDTLRRPGVRNAREQPIRSSQNSHSG